MRKATEQGGAAGVLDAELCDERDPLHGTTLRYGEVGKSEEIPAVLMGKARRAVCAAGHSHFVALGVQDALCATKGCRQPLAAVTARDDPSAARPCGCSARGRHRAGCEDAGGSSRPDPKGVRPCGCGSRGKHRRGCRAG